MRPKTAYWQVLFLLLFELAWLPFSLLMLSSSSPSLNQFFFYFLDFWFWRAVFWRRRRTGSFMASLRTSSWMFRAKSFAPFLMLLLLFLVGEIKKGRKNFTRRNYIRAIAKHRKKRNSKSELFNCYWSYLFLRQFCLSRSRFLTIGLRNDCPGTIKPSFHPLHSSLSQHRNGQRRILAYCWKKLSQITMNCRYLKCSAQRSDG